MYAGMRKSSFYASEMGKRSFYVCGMGKSSFHVSKNQSEFRLMLNLSEKSNYNPNLIWINKIPKGFLCVYLPRRLAWNFLNQVSSFQ